MQQMNAEQVNEKSVKICRIRVIRESGFPRFEAFGRSCQK